MLCTTLFRDVCGDSSLLLSTVVSLPCEVSTEALISYLELKRVSVDRFTVETTNFISDRQRRGKKARNVRRGEVGFETRTFEQRAKRFDQLR